MIKVSLERTKEIFEILNREGVYSPLWNVIEDLKVNGHEVSFKRSTLWGHIIIDNAYVDIREGHGVIKDGISFGAIEYALHRLNEPIA